MKYLVLSLLAVATLSAAPDNRSFTGTITDQECDQADHSRMQMGPTDAQCTIACINFHGATYVLFDGKNIYRLSDQRTPEKFAGQKVKVMGNLDTKTRMIKVVSMSVAK